MNEPVSSQPDCQPPPPLQVAPQPLWFSDTVANLRKLKELPHHLVHSGRIEELKQEVLGRSRARCRGQGVGASPPLCSRLPGLGKGKGQKPESLAPPKTVALTRGHSVPPPISRGHLAKSGDVLVVTAGGGGTTGI